MGIGLGQRRNQGENHSGFRKNPVQRRFEFLGSTQSQGTNVGDRIVQSVTIKGRAESLLGNDLADAQPGCQGLRRTPPVFLATAKSGPVSIQRRDVV